MTSDSIKQIAFIGLGQMGTPMAKRLLRAGFAVRVWNRTAAKMGHLERCGAKPCGSPAQAASGADLVMLCVTDAAAVESVLFARHGVAECAGGPPLIVDLSTIGPAPTLEFAERLEMNWIDAPVSGGAGAAEQGKLVVFCGGRDRDIDRVGPVLGALSQRVTRVGAVGAGQALKLCNQLIVATNMIAIAESMALARDNGVDVGRIVDALTGGAADSLPLQLFGRRMASGIHKPVLVDIALMLKDLGAVYTLERRYPGELSLEGHAITVFRRAADNGLLHADLSELLSLYAPAAPRV